MNEARVRISLRALVRTPGVITRATLDGQGATFIAPGRLLLAFTAGFFVLTALQLRATPPVSPEVASACADANNPSDLGALLDAARSPQVTASASPAAAVILRIAGDALCNPQRYTRALSVAIPVAFLLLMPLLALFMQVAFRSQMPSFQGNWLYGLEAHAALFALLLALAVISLVGSTVLNMLASLGGLVYASWNLVAGVQRAYGVSARTAAWKTTGVGVAYALVLTVVSALLVWLLLARR